MQNVIRQLCAASDKLTDELEYEALQTASNLIEEIEHPLATDEIRALFALFPENGDTAMGLNWTLLHAIEAAPDWPLWDLLGDQSHEWVSIFTARLVNGGYTPPCLSP